MKTIITEQGGNLVAEFEGRLDTSAAPQAEKDLQPLLEDNGHDIILDCTKLEYISSSGLRVFLSILKNAKPKGSHVYVKGLSPDIRNVFTITGFINLFEYK